MLLKDGVFVLWINNFKYSLKTTLAPKSGWKPGEPPDKPWLNQTYQAFDNYQLKLKAWLSLVLPCFQQGKPGYDLPWKSGNSGLYSKILTRNAWLV